MRSARPVSANSAKALDQSCRGRQAQHRFRDKCIGQHPTVIHRAPASAPGRADKLFYTTPFKSVYYLFQFRCQRSSFTSKFGYEFVLNYKPALHYSTTLRSIHFRCRYCLWNLRLASNGLPSLPLLASNSPVNSAQVGSFASASIVIGSFSIWFVCFGECVGERCRAILLIYMTHIWDYKNVGPVMDEMYGDLKNIYSMESTKGFGLYMMIRDK